MCVEVGGGWGVCVLCCVVCCVSMYVKGESPKYRPHSVQLNDWLNSFDILFYQMNVFYTSLVCVSE